MDNWFWFVIALLATERITSIIYREKIAAKIRYLAGERIDSATGLEIFPFIETRFIGKLFNCFWCLSVWVGLFVTLIWFIFPYALLPFALSYLAMVLDEMTINKWLEQTQ